MAGTPAGCRPSACVLLGSADQYALFTLSMEP